MKTKNMVDCGFDNDLLVTPKLATPAFFELMSAKLAPEVRDDAASIAAAQAKRERKAARRKL